jgi:hypothetical protein
MVGHQGIGRWMARCRMTWQQNAGGQGVGRMCDGSWMEVSRMSDESRTDVGWTELSRCCCDGRWWRCTTATGNATLQQGWQSVVVRCCGKADNALQLAAATMADNAATRDAVAMAGSAHQRWPMLWWNIFVFKFFSTTLRERKKETKRKREGKPLKPIQRSPLCWLVWAIPTWPWLIVSMFKNCVRSIRVWWSF